MARSKEWVIQRLRQHWPDLTRPNAPFPCPIPGNLEEVIQVIQERWPDKFTDMEEYHMTEFNLNLAGYESQVEYNIPDYLKIRPQLREMQLDYFDNHFGPMTDEEIRQKAATWLFPREMIDELADIETIMKENPSWLPLYYELMEKLRQSPESPWQPGPLTPVSSEVNYEGYPMRLYHIVNHRISCDALRWNGKIPPEQAKSLAHVTMSELMYQDLTLLMTNQQGLIYQPHFLRVMSQYIRDCQSQLKSVQPSGVPNMPN